MAFVFTDEEMEILQGKVKCKYCSNAADLVNDNGDPICLKCYGGYATHSKPDGIGSGSGLEGDSG